MTPAIVTAGNYLEAFRAFEASLGGGQPEWLRDLRRAAIARFQEIGLPVARKGNEPWKYTNIAPIAGTAFALDGVHEADAARLRRAAPWDGSWATAVFVNGRHAPALSSSPEGGVRVLDLAGAARSHGETVSAHLARHASFEDDGFIALNTAFVDGGAFVHVPAGATAGTPLHLVFASAGDGGPLVSYPRTLIVAGENSRATIIETYVGLTSARRFTDSVTEVVLGDGAQVEHYRVLIEGDGGYHVGVTRVYQGRDSAFTSTVFQRGAALARNDLRVLLDAPGGACTLNGLYITTGSEHIDNYINIDHARPHTNSRLYYKGILDGQSKAVFGGMVLVRPGAVKVDAHQSDKNLLLSAGAEAASKPSLEIYADDVKCGHGATAGAIAEDAIFYMLSRGLDMETASALLIKGFASEVLETVQVGPLRKRLEKLTAAALVGARFAQS